MHLAQHKLCTRKTVLALEVKFYLDVHWVYMDMATSADQLKWIQMRVSAVPHTPVFFLHWKRQRLLRRHPPREERGPEARGEGQGTRVGVKALQIDNSLNSTFFRHRRSSKNRMKSSTRSCQCCQLLLTPWARNVSSGNQAIPGQLPAWQRGDSVRRLASPPEIWTRWSQNLREGGGCLSPVRVSRKRFKRTEKCYRITSKSIPTCL